MCIPPAERLVGMKERHASAGNRSAHVWLRATCGF
jgi:hypothetical protein